MISKVCVELIEDILYILEPLLFVISQFLDESLLSYRRLVDIEGLIQWHSRSSSHLLPNSSAILLIPS